MATKKTTTKKTQSKVLTQAEKEALAKELAKNEKLLEEVKKTEAAKKPAPKKRASKQTSKATSNIQNQVAQQPLTNTKPTKVGQVKGPKTTKAPAATGAGVSSSGVSQAPKRTLNVAETGRVTATGKPILRPVSSKPPAKINNVPVVGNKPEATLGSTKVPITKMRVDVQSTTGEYARREGMKVTGTAPNRTPASAMEYAPSQAKLARDQEQLLRLQRMKDTARKAGAKGKIVAAGLGVAIAGVGAYNKFQEWRKEREAEMEAERKKRDEYRRRR
jgi:hypothetical protein